MNERTFEQAVNTLSIAFVAGRALVALGILRKRKEPLNVESKKALEEALAFIKKANSAEESLKQTHLSLSSLEAFELYTITMEALCPEGENALKKIENTVAAILKGCQLSVSDVEDARVFFSQLMHLASSESSRLLMKE